MAEHETPLRVALVGAAGVGKTTHARELQKKYKGDVLSFATPLKKILRDLWGSRMDNPVFAREQAQKFGTDYVRTVDANIWIEKLVEKISPDRNVFVDDCRFYNEYVALRRLGFIFIRLTAHPETIARRRPTLTPEQARHESETQNLAFNVHGYVSTDPLEVTTSDAEGNKVTVIPGIDTPEDIKAVHQLVVELVNAERLLRQTLRDLSATSQAMGLE